MCPVLWRNLRPQKGTHGSQWMQREGYYQPPILLIKIPSLLWQVTPIAFCMLCQCAYIVVVIVL
ncbi:hypothetical protein DL93DRAFT_2078373 [Clavulina sp. PMI_390]|nr:hypothetical protein DL93DRAFT_2078373 [Clavulina sp. PMI_390]